MPAIDAIVEQLTEQENAVLHLLAEGLSNHEIGERLFLAPSTVKWYVRQLNAKLDTRNRKEIVSRASALGLLATQTTQREVHNLPAMTTPFIGREDALHDVRSLLHQEQLRLITIQGPGGIGKTRLAVEVARALVDQYRDGVYFVDLAPMGHTLAHMKEWVLADFVTKLIEGSPLLDCARRVADLASEPVASYFHSFAKALESDSRQTAALNQLHRQTETTEYGPVVAIIKAHIHQPDELTQHLAHWLEDHRAGLHSSLPNDATEDARILMQNINAVVQAVGYDGHQDNKPLNSQMLSFFSKRHLLLVLDNFEYVLNGSPMLIELLAHAPHIRILVTSREKLNLAGETVYSLRGMQSGQWETLADAHETDCVQLFVHSARRTNPNFGITEDDLEALQQICQLTGGMPLGLLLAASWADVLTVQEIADELHKSVEFLQTDQQDIADRHRSIRGIFNATWQRLSTDEQDAFMRLSLFRDGCTRDAAASVAGADAAVIRGLVTHSLVYVLADGRYRIHELCRQFGEQRLVDASHYRAVGLDHAMYFVDQAEQAEPELRSHEQERWYALLETEADNIRIALQYAVDNGEYDLALTLVGALCDYWFYNGHHVDGVYWSTLILSRTKDRNDILRAKVLISGAILQYAVRNVELALEFLDEAMPICERENHIQYLGWATMYYGEFLSCIYDKDPDYYEPEKFETVIDYCERGLALLRQVDDKAGIVQALNVLGNRYIVGDLWHERGKSIYEECLAASREIGETRRELIIYSNMAQIAYMHGEHDLCVRNARECLKRSSNVKFDYFVATTLLNLTGSLAALGKASEAVLIFGAVKRYEHRYGISHTPGQQNIYDHMLHEVHDLVEAEAFQIAYGWGQAMTLDEAVRFALSIDVAGTT